MERELVSINNYGLFTFNTTSQALKAEKVLKNSHGQIMVIPTLREISASCGLSIKFYLNDWIRYYEILQSEKVSIEGIYEVEKVKGRHLVKKLNPDELPAGH